MIITQNEKEMERFIPKDTASSTLTDSLTGILKGSCTLEQAREERLKEKYELTE